MQACNPSSREAEAEGSRVGGGVQAQPGLQSETPCPKEKLISSSTFLGNSCAGPSGPGTLSALGRGEGEPRPSSDAEFGTPLLPSSPRHLLASDPRSQVRPRASAARGDSCKVTEQPESGSGSWPRSPRATLGARCAAPGLGTPPRPGWPEFPHPTQACAGPRCPARPGPAPPAGTGPR